MKISPLQHPPGFISLGFLGYIAIVGLLIVGGQGVYVALKNHEPLGITVADYAAKKTNAEWMTLKDSQVSLEEAAYKLQKGVISEVFIPVRSLGESPDSPAHILLSTEDPAVVATLKELSGTGRKKFDTGSRNAGKLLIEKEITGLIRYGFFYDLFVRARLAKLNLKLAEDFVILNDGAAPDLFMSLSLLGGGLLIGFFMLCSAMYNALWRWRRKRTFYRQRPAN
jgi:hypothetical protein